MLVNITRSFAFGGREYVAGQNPDVDPQIARQWIADGRATADADNNMDWPSPALQALVLGAWVLPAPPPVRDYIELIPASDISKWPDRSVPAGGQWVQDNAVLFDGKPTLRLDIPAGQSGTFRIGTTVEAPGSLPYAWAGDGLNVALMSSNLACVSGVDVLVCIDTAFAGWYNWGGERNVGQVPEPGYVANEWMCFKPVGSGGVITTNGTAGAFTTLSGQRRMRINLSVTSVGTATSVWIGLFAVAPKRKPTVIISADDGYASWYSFLRPLAKFYQIPVSMCIDSAYIGQPGYLTEAQIREMNADPSGLFEFVNHGRNNESYGTVGAAAYYANMEATRARLNGMGINDGALHHAFVQGQYGNDIIALMQAGGYLSGRAGGGVTPTGIDDRVMVTGHDKQRWVLRHATSPTTGISFAAAQALIQDATVTQKHSVTHINLHDFAAADAASPPTWSYDKTTDLFGWLASRRDAGEHQHRLWGKWHADATGRPYTR